MSVASYVKELVPKITGYKLAKIGLISPPLPANFTISITNMCNSRCKTCNVWKVYRDNPKKKEKELTINEIEKIFKSIGHTYFLNISGGEPFMRSDFPEIIEAGCKYLTPRVIHTPTNALMPKKIEEMTEKILKIINKYNPKIDFTIKPSFDGIGAKHDKIRGIKGNFNKTMETIERLNKLKKKYPNLHVGLGTVISKFNLKDIKETADFVKKLNVDTYINEMAEQRSELFNLTDKITPSAKEYEEAIKVFSNTTKDIMKKSRFLDRMVLSLRLAYYELAVRILKEEKQVIPCYSAIANAHISPYGDVWPCCILGYSKSLGNLRDYNYDFRKLWVSKRAKEVRKFIKDKKCHCPLANIALTNIMCNPRYLCKAMKHAILG